MPTFILRDPQAVITEQKARHAAEQKRIIVTTDDHESSTYLASELHFYMDEPRWGYLEVQGADISIDMDRIVLVQDAATLKTLWETSQDGYTYCW
jgi:hypothetical protein